MLSALRLHGGAARAPESPASKDRPPTAEELREAARAERALGRVEADALRHSTAIVPEDAHEDGTGERVRRFEGFGVSVESVPAGAWVRAGGEELGITPLVASVPCTPGAPIVLEIGRAGLRTVRRTVSCREDVLVELSVTLKP